MLQKAISNLKNQEGEGEGGFTLIELLVVILIIGILAAIALPTFLGQSDKAKDASSKSDARNAVTQVESCLVDEADGTTCSNGTQVPGLPSSVVISGTTAGSKNYVITSSSTSGNSFIITKTGAGTFDRTCTTTGKGACPSTGKW